MTCDKAPSNLEAYADGELDAVRDAATIAVIAEHLATCAICKDEVVRMRALSGALRKHLPSYLASDVLRARMKALVAQSSAPAQATASTPSIATAIPMESKANSKTLRNWKIFAIAASTMLMVVSAHDFTTRNSGNDTKQFAGQELINAHIRSLMSDHIVDVPSSDRHTVKPWFEGKINFSPSVFDFSADSFPLAGGRLDYATGHAMAAIVFHSGQHAINLFVWPSDSADAAIASTSHDGYNLAVWRRNHLQYSAVSTLNSGSLARFAALYLQRDSTTGAVQR